MEEGGREEWRPGSPAVSATEYPKKSPSLFSFSKTGQLKLITNMEPSHSLEVHSMKSLKR